VENTKTYLTGGRGGGNFKHLWLSFNKIYRASLKQKGGRPMVSIFRRFTMIGLFVTAFMGVLQSPAFGFPLTIELTINAIDDAGQSPNQVAYLRFAYVDPSSGNPAYYYVLPVGSQWTSRVPVDQFAIDHNISGWQLESEGNIWSPSPDNDFIVGDALINLPAGIYRISVVAGAFQYDSFNWSDYAGQWRWQLQIQAQEFDDDGNIVGYHDYGLGFFGLPIDYYPSKLEAIQENRGKYLDVPVNEGGSLNFWIWDWNSIDNSGSLTFDVAMAPIPEPSTLILVGTGLFFLARRFRRSNIHLK